MYFLKFYSLIVLIACFSKILPLSATPELTVVGIIIPEDGLGKVPVNIIETIGKDFSINIKTTANYSSKQKLPPLVASALTNPDHSAGKVALLTEILWSTGSNPFSYVPQESLVKLAYSMLETTRIPSMWVKILNEQFDGVIVPDQFLVPIYEQSGVHIPIFVLPIPMMLDAYYAHPIHPKTPTTPFTFGDASANKNPGVLVEAFARAFGNNSDVRLVMRAGGLSQETKETINRIINQFGLTNVIIEHGHLDLPQYMERLASFDCYVNLSRGEGFSFIPREALAMGIPVIVTNNTASTTICKTGFVRAVPSLKKGPSNSIYQMMFNESCGEQFDCEVNDAAAALRDVYENYEKFINKARKGRKWVDQYNCSNSELQSKYRALIMPKKIVLGNINKIKNDVIMTNSKSLYQKYQRIIND